MQVSDQPTTAIKAGALDNALDLSVVLGYSKIGHALRRLPPLATRMDHRRVVITGATGGIGRAAAVAMGRLGATVILVGRNDVKLAATAAEVEAAGGTAAVEQADLSLMSQVASLGDRLATSYPHIDVLVNNVGVLHRRRTETAEGLETTFATNLLGQFILTERLVGVLEASPVRARIITVSSGGMYTSRLSAADLQSTHSYSGPQVYARTKRAQVALTEMWAERHAPAGIVAHSMHPGWVATAGVSESLPTFSRLMRPILRTPEQGADTIVWLATNPLPASSTGLFWHDRVARPTHRFTTDNPDQRRRLWMSLEAMAKNPERRR